MRITSIKVKNFRLLSEAKLALEGKTTVIVGRNNSGKTSLTELMKRFIGSDSPSFQLEDFSVDCNKRFLDLFKQNTSSREILPAIELHLTIQYDKNIPNFGSLSPFVIDLNPDCTEALIIIRYELEYGKLRDFFDPNINLEDPFLFSKELRSRISKYFNISVLAQDPDDENNQRELTLKDVKKLIKVDFINAQRGLDDITTKESKPLAKLLESFFDYTSISKNKEDQSITRDLEASISDIQKSINDNFSKQLEKLLPSLEQFGYPGLGTQLFQTEVILDVKKLLSNFANIHYPSSGINFPESYNGLGTRNLILILLQIAKFYKEFSVNNSETSIHLVFIEEPEAHLHPQMQEVFIKQLEEIPRKLSDNEKSWSPQFIISTHSSHISNTTSFENIRYFLQDDQKKTKIKDFRIDFSDNSENKEFLHKYMTLTKSDLFFADKAILVEGLTERLMIPRMIEKLDNSTNLKTSYLTILEISGAYAHKFIPLLEFLELKTLIITDLDSINTENHKACEVHKGNSTSNACIKSWFDSEQDLSIIREKTDSDKIKCNIRIAYQCKEYRANACGRSFEDAFILANKDIFDLKKTKPNELETEAYEKAEREVKKKSDFAIQYAINEISWKHIPKYIREGLIWLAEE